MKGTLTILSGAQGERTIQLDEGRYEIGRGEEAHIQIDSRSVSRRHAEVVVENSRVRLIDCGSHNGTQLNGKQITAADMQDGDRISIGEIVIEFHENASASKEAPAHAISYSPDRAFHSRSLRRLFTLVFLVSLGTIGLVGGLSYRSLLLEKLTVEALDRASYLVRLMAEKNKEDLRLGNELLLDIDFAKKEKGVREAFIINAKGRILAPISRLNQPVVDPFTTEALAQKSDRKVLPSPRGSDGTYILVHPIRAYSDKKGTYETLGIAKLVFAPTDLFGSVPEANRLLYLLLGCAVGLALLLGWAAERVVTRPIREIGERIQQVRAGLEVAPHSSPFDEWESLYEAVDRLSEEKKPR